VLEFLGLSLASDLEVANGGFVLTCLRQHGGQQAIGLRVLGE
jgi:hypothetical protein